MGAVAIEASVTSVTGDVSTKPSNSAAAYAFAAASAAAHAAYACNAKSAAIVKTL